MHGKTVSGLLILASAATLAACGGSNDSSTTPQTEFGASSTTSASTSAGKGLEIKMGDDFFSPQDASTDAGTVTINAVNSGNLVHEIVLAKTKLDPSQLPTTSDGEVDEAKLESQGADAGEIADVSPGASKSGDFKLSPGTYVMYCNIPGHYAAGMYGTITAK